MFFKIETLGLIYVVNEVGQGTLAFVPQENNELEIVCDTLPAYNDVTSVKQALNIYYYKP